MVRVVDDSPLEAEFVREVLSRNYAVTVFGSGETMLDELASDSGPDVLVLDGQLPGLSGVELCRCLRANPTTLALPLRLQSVHGTRDDVVRGLAAGAVDDGLIQRERALSPAQGGRTPAVALTAFARTEDRTRALLAGFQMHVPKPIEPTELLVVRANLVRPFSRF